MCCASDFSSVYFLSQSHFLLFVIYKNSQVGHRWRTFYAVAMLSLSCHYAVAMLPLCYRYAIAMLPLFWSLRSTLNVALSLSCCYAVAIMQLEAGRRHVFRGPMFIAPDGFHLVRNGDDEESKDNKHPRIHCGMIIGGSDFAASSVSSLTAPIIYHSTSDGRDGE